MTHQHNLLKIIPVTDLKSENTNEVSGLESLSYILKKIIVKEKRVLRVISISEIAMIEAYSNYSLIFCNGKSIITSSTLKHWSSQINHPYFIRVHKSFIVNKYHIEAVDNSNKTLTLLNGRVLPISRKMTNFSKIIRFDV